MSCISLLDEIDGESRESFEMKIRDRFRVNFGILEPNLLCLLAASQTRAAACTMVVSQRHLL